MKSKKLKLAALAVGVLCAAPLANAQITGELWENGANALNADTSIGSLGAANVTFTVPTGALDFDSRLDGNNVDYTIGGWLATGGASITSGAGHSGDTMNNTIVYLTGQVSVTSGENFTVEQDDGLVLVIDGIDVLDNPNPTPPNSYSGTYTGPTGNETFTLEYSEVSGAPAVLDVDLPFTPAVPEASTLMAGAAMLLPLGLSAIRAVRKNRA